LARISKRGTPQIGIIVSTLLTTALLLLNYTRGLKGLFEFIILLSTTTVLVSYLFCALAEILTRPKTLSRWSSMLMTSTAFIAFAYSLWATAGTGREAVYWGTLLLFCGLPVYAWMRRRHATAIGVSG